MPHERFYVDQPLEGTVVLEDQEFHHLCRVMRGRVGDRVELVNGKCQLAQATISQIGKREALLEVNEATTASAPKKRLILAQGIPRIQRLEMVLEKGTELGVTDFWLFPGILGEREGFSAHQLKRMELILIAAMKQCGRLDLPRIELRPPLLEWKPSDGTLLFGDTDRSAPWLEKVSIGDEPLVLCIGPESGFDPRETEHLKEVLGATGVRLHENILRTETASIAGIVILNSISRLN